MSAVRIALHDDRFERGDLQPLAVDEVASLPHHVEQHPVQLDRLSAEEDARVGAGEHEEVSDETPHARRLRVRLADRLRVFRLAHSALACCKSSRFAWTTVRGARSSCEAAATNRCCA